MKWILFCGLLTAFGSAAFWAEHLGERPTHGSAGAEPVDPTVACPADATDRPSVFATGFLEGARREAALQFDVPGRLLRLHVAEGGQVRAGQLLAELDATVQEQELNEAQAQLEFALAERERTRNAARPETRRVAHAEVAVRQVEVERLGQQLERIKRLHTRGAATDQELEDAIHLHRHAIAQHALAQAQAAETEAAARPDELRIAEAKVTLAEARRQSAEAHLAKTRLSAPMDGVVLSIDADPGEIVGPESVEPVVVLADTSSFRVRAYVEEFDAMRVSCGNRAEIVVDGREPLRLIGHIVSCSEIMKPKRYRTFRPDERMDVMTREIIIELADAGNLVVGLPADVYITPTANMPAGSMPSVSPSGQDAQPLLTNNGITNNGDWLEFLMQDSAERLVKPDFGPHGLSQPIGRDFNTGGRK